MGSDIAEQLLSRLEPLLDRNKAEFHCNTEIPCIVFDDFLDTTLARQVANEFPALGDARWEYNYHYNERKLGYNLAYELPPTVEVLVKALSSKAFVDYLVKLTMIEGLVPDYSHSRAMHYAPAGGYINLHMDPNVHPSDRHLKRQVNLLLYLNENWEEAYGGELQIWDRAVTQCYKKLLPILNRCIIFNTTKVMHGFPDPIKCPEGQGRKAIVMYYFTRESKVIPQKVTGYKARPNDPISVKINVVLGKVLLRIFYFLRDHFGLKQEVAGQITKFVESIRLRKK